MDNVINVVPVKIEKDEEWIERKDPELSFSNTLQGWFHFSTSEHYPHAIVIPTTMDLSLWSIVYGLTAIDSEVKLSRV